jgi:hypothetical protein
VIAQAGRLLVVSSLAPQPGPEFTVELDAVPELGRLASTMNTKDCVN